jgi:signal transduction histidine kinase
MRLFSNALAAIIVPPVIVIMLRSRFSLLHKAHRSVQIEAAALFLVLCAVSWLVFHQPRSAGEAAMYVYAPLPLLVWAAVRVGVGGLTTSVAVLALFSITGTLRGTGPFVLAGPDTAVVSLQVFLIIAASSLMLLAAALAELRDARAAALRRKDRLDLALSAAHMGAWEWDLLTDRISWRLAAESGEIPANAAGSAAELLGIVHPEDRGRLLAAMRTVREDGGADEVECRFQCDGRVRWIRGLGKVERDAAGRPRMMIGVCIDTTQRKHQELRQRSQREKLAHLTRAATLGELSGVLAHELSQPLAAILINTQVARQELRRASPDMEEVGAILDDIVADDERAGEVISRLRALFPRDPVEMERVQVAECIRSILALEHSDLLARNIAVDLSIDPALPPVTAAHAQIQQVLLNLIVNACEAMAGRSGERRLHITARGREGEVHVEVSDNGSGVEDFGRIFEPFYSTKKRGVGLGLSISRTIIAAHGGRLWGANNPAGGATFCIALPAHEEVVA